MSEKCCNNDKNISDNPLTSRRTDGGKNESWVYYMTSWQGSRSSTTKSMFNSSKGPLKLASVIYGLSKIFWNIFSHFYSIPGYFISLPSRSE